MNQILSMGNEPQKKEINEVKLPINTTPQLESIRHANSVSNKADLAKVVRIFCILIIVFGLVLMGQSTYAMIANREKQKDEISVSEEQMGKETKITVETNYPIKSFTYKWNDGQPATIEGNGTVLFETVIQIPNGNNILNMTVTDYFGSEHKLKNRQYIYESSDVNKPNIEIGINGTKLNITATDDTEMGYITYSWNGEDAIRVDVEEENKQKISVDVEVPEGQNKLTIIASDKEGNRETRTENVVGDTKPTFTASLNGQKLIVSASDDQGLSKISITVDNDTVDSGDEPINQKEITATVSVPSGTHTITIYVTNINGLTATETYTAEI